MGKRFVRGALEGGLLATVTRAFVCGCRVHVLFSAEKARLSDELRAARETAKRTTSDEREKALHGKLIQVGIFSIWRSLLDASVEGKNCLLFGSGMRWSL